ncbi:glycosyltransferase family 1 protein [Gryllotalpicola kribbensis]|uniref:Glycosyltransferase family 1 protein n=1 Tax=Gryllotalpicola kribbensis TaxID=993084 RepID=A0ABP8AMS3_9MICO
MSAHIAIDARRINTSTGRYIERLLHHLERLDERNRYTVLVPHADLDYWTPQNPRFTTVPSDFAIYSLAEQTGFKRQLDGIRADLVHFPMPQQPLRYRGPHVTTFHDLTLINTYNSDKRWLEYRVKQLVGRYAFRHALRSSAHIMVPSAFTRDALVEFGHIDRAKVTVTYEAAELPEGARAAGEPAATGIPFARYLLYVGLQPDYKNIRRLAQAHQRLLDRHPDLGLVLVGTKFPSVQANERLFSELGYRNIHFTGYLSEAELDAAYRGALAYVFPSLSEGFGLPGLEAMLRGVPVVSSRASCLPEIYGDAARYFDPMDVDDMARVIATVVESAPLRAQLKDAGDWRASQFSWRRMAEQTLGVYESVLAR